MKHPLKTPPCSKRSNWIESKRQPGRVRDDQDCVCFRQLHGAEANGCETRHLALATTASRSTTVFTTGPFRRTGSGRASPQRAPGA